MLVRLFIKRGSHGRERRKHRTRLRRGRVTVTTVPKTVGARLAVHSNAWLATRLVARSR